METAGPVLDLDSPLICDVLVPFLLQKLIRKKKPECGIRNDLSASQRHANGGEIGSDSLFI
jgi:hypothetical protein